MSADCPCLSLFYPSSNSSPQHSRVPQLPLCCSRTSYPNTRDSNWKPAYFPALLSSSLSLLTLLHCSSSQLSFPAVCLGAASPSSSSHSSHPSLTFVCEPPCLWFPSYTCRHTSAPPALCSTFSFFEPALHTNILCSDTILHQPQTFFAANYLGFNSPKATQPNSLA